MVTQDLGGGGVIVRERMPSSDVVRVRFAEIDGLRALAIAAIVMYETLRIAPVDLSPGFARAAADAGQGLALFLAISGFTLAYPALVALREDGGAYLDVARYAVKRALRIYPAYLIVLGLTIVLPPLARRYGLPALAGGAPLLDFDAFARNAFFAGDGLGNDGFVALATFARCYVLFPFALALWAKWPRAYPPLLALVALVDVATPAHAFGLGAIVPFALGIVAADVRVQRHRVERYALGIAAFAAVAAILVEPSLLKFESARSDAGLRIDPLWSLALAALIAGAASWRILERALGISLLRLVGSASFAISLVVVPVTAFVVRQLGPSIGATGAAVNAAAVAVVAGFLLWQSVDRWFADAPLRRSAADVAAPPLGAMLRAIRSDRVRIGATEPDAAGDAVDPGAGDDYYAPPPRPALADLASMSQRTGSPEEFAAEIHETKRRLAERSASLFAVPDALAEAYERPGFYRKADHEPKRVDVRNVSAEMRNPRPTAETAAPAVAAAHRAEPAIAPDPLVAHFALEAPAAERAADAGSQPIRIRLGPSPNHAEDRAGG